VNVRLAEAGERAALGRLLGAAFRDDPLWAWVAADDTRRRRHLGALFGQLIRRRVHDGTTWTTDDLGAAAAWAAPGEWRTGVDEQLRMAVPFVRAVGPGAVRSRLGALARMEAMHPDEPHWYLEIIGADPSRRGQGLGSALIEAGLERCELDGLPAYLESSKEANLSFYGRYGFEVVDEVRLHRDAPPVWPMWRPAR
jgi:ribosomal protein S18 acetylase RimI-like enzyme